MGQPADGQMDCLMNWVTNRWTETSRQVRKLTQTDRDTGRQAGRQI